MFLVTYFILFYLCSVQFTVSINPLNLYDISYLKQSVIIRNHKANLYFLNGSNRTCYVFNHLSAHELSVYQIDLREVYPIILVKISVNFDRHMKPEVKLILDDLLCATPILQRGANMMKCIVPLSGRVFTIKIIKSIIICEVQIFTCAPGKSGPNCTDMCPNGTYGAACRSCNCRAKEACRKSDGLCQSGCSSFSYDKNYDCYYTTISRSKGTHFAWLERASLRGITYTPSINKNEILLNKSKTLLVKADNCTIFKAKNKGRDVTFELSYQPALVPRQIVITYCHLRMPVPYSLHITVNGHSCFGITTPMSLTLGSHTFFCQRKVPRGSSLAITHTGHDLNSNSEAEVGLNMIAILACSSGFYGRTCQLRCQCLGPSCDPVTGVCPMAKCGGRARGRSCSSMNVALARPVEVRTNVHRPLSPRQEDSAQTANYAFWPIFAPERRKYVMSWRTIQLDGVYYIQGFNIHIDAKHVDKFRSVTVYTDTRVFHYNDIRSPHFWRGLECPRQPGQPISTAIDLQCAGPARTITVVSYSHFLVTAKDIKDVEVWVCQDGTYGPLCEGICNCLDPNEVCNMKTGACAGGCAEGYWGVDCQSPCESGTEDMACWKFCNCRRATLGCGPGVIICKDSCTSGWMGVQCSIPCPQGWYGPDCDQQCGSCRAGNQNVSCNPVTGHCLYGCSNGLQTPTCKMVTEYPGLSKKAVSFAEPANIIKYMTFGLGGVLVLASVMYLCVRLFHIKDDTTAPEQIKMSSDLNEKIMREHRDYHEDYVHKKVLEQATTTPPDRGLRWFMKRVFKLGDQAHSKTRESGVRLLFGMKKDYKGKPAGADRCQPLDDNTQQNADHKVAQWILHEDFSELINRRQDRLQHFKGDVLQIKESLYSIGSFNMTKEEIDKLYDEVGTLGIP